MPVTKVRRHYRPHSRRDTRPYIQALVRQYEVLLSALLDELARLEGKVYTDEEWPAIATRVHELREEVGATQWRIFRACGYSLAVLRRLRGRT